MTGATLSARKAVWRDGWILPLLERAGLLGPLEHERVDEAGGSSAWRACLKAGIASEDAVLEAVATRFRMSVATPDELATADAHALPGEVAVRLRVVPLEVRDQVLHVACSDPVDLDLDSAVAFAAGHRVRLVLASPTVIDATLARLYPGTAVG